MANAKRKGRPPGTKDLDKDWLDEQREKVCKMASYGQPDSEIADILDISEPSVKRHFRDELSQGRGHLRRNLRRAQLKSAIEERNPTMLIWMGKQYLGQREPKKELEHSGEVKYLAVNYADVDSIGEDDEDS